MALLQALEDRDRVQLPAGLGEPVFGQMQGTARLLPVACRQTGLGVAQ